MSYDDKSIDIGYRPKSSNVKARWDRATFPQDSLFDNFSRFFLSRGIDVTLILFGPFSTWKTI